ncbi:MAG: hypothetical protein LBC09_04395, partial [Helicobacteraceae bacterium]|nr:hypothetical protein [Helicobacteraceae bacterium]
MRVTRLIPLLLIACATLSANGGDQCLNFGKGIKPITNAKSTRGVVDFSGDYNGDGITDRLVFMRLPSKPNFAKDINIINMFDRTPKHPENGSVGIAFILAGKTSAECKKYIIYNDGFFDIDISSMWDDPSELPFYIIKKDNKGYVARPDLEMSYFTWKEQTPDL